VRDHRSLEAWRCARTVALATLDASRDHWKPYAAPVFLQLQRAALSVQLNIAEGYALGSRRGFASHLRIAYGSAVETRDLLDLAAERALLPEALLEESIEHNTRCQRLLVGLMKRYRDPP
jgi:four helix bundle protein